ncbi:PP2C family protein-serine/threonine phosphatase [Alloacidobacterium sp.]|uniref:PP2C family protein-serine/threonine phosphatase n=1 Tax=Alloacidobacterium sp. TaxID=2951999 RepID=UPI002D7005C9|nr:SpoIIE family protein phosphatase [Alloacidobacterium sp.]HYK35905.1 SpoIIE family protein phosphatase [Alloacidobacterium sp.]
MSSPASGVALGHRHHAHRCSFHPDRQDLYLRLGTVNVFVRDQERSLRFYVEQLGFELALDTESPSGERLVTVAPPDGTAMLALTSPRPGSEEYKLIGRPMQIAFLTEDVFGKYKEWRNRGVPFLQEPQTDPFGSISTTFQDIDGNSFTLTTDDSVVREVEEHRREHIERFEAERRTAQELEHAREVQAQLFPRVLPSLATLQYEGLCIQARSIGGDYYDFLELGGDRMGLVIGDVSGKGTAAALLMANLQAHFRNLCTTYSSRPFVPFALEQPQRLLHAVNRLFCENTADHAFATLFFSEYDDAARRLRYANCGHLPALLLRSNNDLEWLDSTGTVVGLFKNWECSVGECQLSAGDTVVLYTDGVTESFDAEGEQFGEERLVNALLRNRELDSQALLGALVREVRGFSGERQHDDITLIVAKCG